VLLLKPREAVAKAAETVGGQGGGRGVVGAVRAAAVAVRGRSARSGRSWPVFWTGRLMVGPTQFLYYP
jgi:hypothetical protein